VHSLANGPEVKNPLLGTSRKGYLAAISASSYSLISMLQVGCGPPLPPSLSPSPSSWVSPRGFVLRGCVAASSYPRYI
jgi:hypothetical protein